MIFVVRFAQKTKRQKPYRGTQNTPSGEVHLYAVQGYCPELYASTVEQSTR